MNNNIHKKLSDSDKIMKKAFSTKLCAVPNSMRDECLGKIINAHTISRCLGLDSMASNGEVFGLRRMSQYDIHKHNGEFIIEKMGVRKASVLSCFCAKHDVEIFSEIENAEFIASPKQYFLLAYRALIGEWYKTIASPIPEIFKEKIDSSFSEQKPILDDIIIPPYLNNEDIIPSWKETIFNDHYYIKGMEYKKRDLEIDKEKLDNILISKDFLKMQHYIFEGNRISDVVFSFALNPNISFENNIIQDYSNPDYIASVYINGITKNNKSYVVFSWINDDFCNNIIKDFFGNLRSNDPDIIEYNILEFVFKNCENTYFSINWWDNLHQTQKKYLRNWIQPQSERTLNKFDHNIRFMGLQNHYLLN